MTNIWSDLASLARRVNEIPLDPTLETLELAKLTDDDAERARLIREAFASDTETGGAQ